MTKDQILAVRRPEDLFPSDKDAAQSIYRKMAKAWHPDLATGSAAVFDHITQLYRNALEKIHNGTWEGPAFVQYEAQDKVFHSYQALTSYSFPYGHAVVADHALVFLFSDSTPFGTTVQRMAPGVFPFAGTSMREEFDRYLPHIAVNTSLADGRYLLQVQKTPELVRLRDVVTHYGQLEGVHLAWIVSSLLNIACYLTYAHIVHHDISPDTVFISPEHHSVALLGGWWSSVPRGSTVHAVPARTYGVMPFNAKLLKRASTLTDLELIRLTARECAQPLPDPMGTWLSTPGHGNAMAQYTQWHGVLGATFGKRRFVQFPVTAKHVYQVTGKVV